MSTFSDQDFDKIVAEFAKTTIGQALVKNYVPIKGTVIDSQGATHDDYPTGDNAFVMSCEQRADGPGKMAHTRIDIRGPDGLIHTSYERDHVHFEYLDDVVINGNVAIPGVDLIGKELLADVEINQKSTRLGAEPNEFVSVVLLPKGTILTQDNLDELRAYRILKVPTKLMTPEEVAAALVPFMELDHVIQGMTMTALELATVGLDKKAEVGTRP